MTIKLKGIDIDAKIPEFPSAMPVFKVNSPTFDKRKKVIDFFTEIMKFGKLVPVEVQDSLHLISNHGEIQYYKPSGSIWICNTISDDKYTDECRNWNVVKTKDRDDPDITKLVLVESEQKKLLSQTNELFKKANILEKEAYFSGVELDQVAKIDNEGKEIGLFAGEANVKFLYKLDGIKVDGPGAKSYAFFNPGKKTHQLNGVFHAWREVVGVQKISMPSIEEALEITIAQDRELVLYKKKQYSIKVTEIDLVYFSLPPFKYQNYIFPAFHVIGSVIPKDKKHRQDGFEFARYYNAAPPKSYAKADIYADYLATHL